ncbi:alpha-2-antiplasmin [Hyla sarda]|uniref:alpha-2-antiplasmin n=1 Tax=Hyla sarda TaxID=327740 RepID=UPI0024C31D5D|nr:alpha-2-antiplasmin [Hyla sarda]
MDKVVFCLLVLAGICSLKAEVNEEFVTDTTATTPVTTTPHTETTHSPIVDSTSDSLLDIYPHLTESFTTTTSTAAPEESSKPPDPTVAFHPKECSSEEVGFDLAFSSENECDGVLSPADVQKFGRAMNKFSMDLLKQVELESQNPNVVVSPFSIALGLLQLALGAENQTETHILEALHVESLQCLHEKLHKVTKRLVKSSLSLATRMYIKKDFQIKKSFLKRSERLYGTKPVNLKQDMRQNLEDINKWVKDATRGKIPNFLSNIPSNIVLMLLNALHFKGTWRNRFDPAKTVPDVFAISDDETVMVDMMQSLKYPLSYFTHEKINSQVARIPFKGNLSFVVVLPNNMNWNLSRILDKLNRTELYNKLHKEKPTTLKVPKLNLDFKLELGHVLSNLGLGELFTNPNLKGISDEHLFVSSVEHQSTLQLNEEGVEAAAATASIMSRSLSTFSINRPFIYFLYDDMTSLPLFLGYVRNPKPGSEKKRKESVIPDHKPISKGSIPK